MRQIKSERLKKLEQELSDLEQWLKLGLVPKKDIERHKEEIDQIRQKMEEEKERLQFLKESGEIEEYVTPKRQQGRSSYTEMPSIPDIDVTESSSDNSETRVDSETEGGSSDTTIGDSEDTESEATYTEDDESIFSDKNRWRRGAREIIDPDANEW